MNSVRIRFTRTASRLITLKSNGEFLGFRFRSRYRHRNNLRFGEHTTPRAAAVALWPALVLGAAEHDSDSSSNLQRFQSIYRSTASLRDIPRLVGDAVQDVSSRARSSFQERMESEGGNVTSNITSVNVAVYILWKIAPTGIMVRHFANSLEAIRRARLWTALTSNFSHMGIFHLISNMYLLNRFGKDVADVLGRERFYLFYCSAGIASSLASLTFRRISKSNVLSLGASGAVVATMWLYACFFPDRRMSILGSEKTVTMQELVLAYTVIDAAGLLGAFGKIDFAAHIGGAVFGNFWFYLVRDKLVQESMQRNGERPQILSGLRQALHGSENGDMDDN